MMRYVFFAPVLLMILAVPAFAWIPPIGIPAPAFGINEQAPAVPNPWTSSTAGFYYVDQSGACSDASNGYPALPRCTIPGGVPAGSVIEIHGSISSSEVTITMSGTAANPIFIRGASPSQKPKIKVKVYIQNSQYLVFENLEFAPLVDTSSPTAGRIEIGSLNQVVSYVSIRNNDMHGSTNTGGIGGGGMNNIVIFNNTIHDNGDWLLGTAGHPCGGAGQPSCDQDVHGVNIVEYSQNVWVVDNEFYHNSGDGIQVNGYQYIEAGVPTNIYVGRNVAHHNKQTGVWTKTAKNVIISQNTIYGHRPSISSGGAGTGFQYAPQNAWFLFNNIYDNEIGVGSGGDSCQAAPAYCGRDIFIIGNLIHNIHSSDGYDPTKGGWGEGAFSLQGATNRFIIGNTIYDVDAGFNTASSAATYIYNNIFSPVSLPYGQGNHIYIEIPGMWDIKNNLFYQNGAAARINIGNTIYTLDQIKAPPFNNGTGSLMGNPLFVSSTDFHLQPGSPAINAGADSAWIINYYRSLYGLDISVDLDNVTRPQPAGGSWDMGAYEYVSGGSDTWPPYISGGLPAGYVGTTTSVVMSVNTSEAATCKYSATPGVAYGSMTNTFTNTGGLTHAVTLSNLVANNLYNYSVRCSDALGNVNTNDYSVAFTVLSNPACSLTIPSNVAANQLFNMTWNATGAIHAASSYTGNTLYNSTGSVVAATGDLYFLVNFRSEVKVAATSGTTTINFCFDQSTTYTGTYDQCLARTPHIVCSQVITVGGSDTTPPTRSNGQPSGALTSGTTQAALSLNTNEAATCRYSTTANTAYSSMTNAFTTTGGTSHSTVVTGLSNGNSYNYYARCVDSSNNANTNDFAISFSVGAPTDTTPPTVSVTSPTAGAVVSGSTSITATASDNMGVAGVTFKLDGVSISSEVTTPPYTITWNTASFSDGYHNITATARDASNNVATSTVSVQIRNAETTPPTVSITSPFNGSAVSGGSVILSASASDNSGAVLVTFMIDNTQASSEISSPPYSVFWNTINFLNGFHNITAVARDASNNIATSAVIKVIVNNSGPSSYDSITIQGTIKTKGLSCGNCTVNVTIAGITASGTTNSTGGFSITVPVTLVTGNTYQVGIVVSDGTTTRTFKKRITIA